MMHALAFKQCAFVIECLEEIKKYNDEWKQRRNYCLFKATDIMRWLKAGTVPVRGNPNNEGEQEKFDVEEGSEEKQPIRQSTKGGTTGIAPRPDLGLPPSDEDDDEKKESESDEDSDEKPKHSSKRPAEPSKPSNNRGVREIIIKFMKIS